MILSGHYPSHLVPFFSQSGGPGLRCCPSDRSYRCKLFAGGNPIQYNPIRSSSPATFFIELTCMGLRALIDHSYRPICAQSLSLPHKVRQNGNRLTFMGLCKRVRRR